MQVVLEHNTLWTGDVVKGTAYFHNATRPINYDAVFIEVREQRLQHPDCQSLLQAHAGFVLCVAEEKSVLQQQIDE